MNMYLYELKSQRKSAVLWICTMIFLAVLFLSLYPNVADDAQGFKNILAGYPEAVRAMLGIDLDYMSSMLGFYSMIFSFIALCAAIQAMNLGVSVLSRETRERTADFLLVKPVSRTTIVTAKLLAALTTIIITNAVFCIASTVMAEIVKTSDFSVRLFIIINLTLFFLQLIFLALGAFVSVFFKRLKNILPLSLGVVLGLYFIGALLVTDQDAAAARFLSPFKYFNVPYIIKNAGYEVRYLVFGAFLVIASVVAGYIIYNKKDIHAVS